MAFNTLKNSCTKYSFFIYKFLYYLINFLKLNNKSYFSRNNYKYYT
jgi:hypothetical protein